MPRCGHRGGTGRRAKSEERFCTRSSERLARQRAMAGVMWARTAGAARTLRPLGKWSSSSEAQTLAAAGWHQRWRQVEDRLANTDSRSSSAFPQNSTVASALTRSSVSGLTSPVAVESVVDLTEDSEAGGSDADSCVHARFAAPSNNAGSLPAAASYNNNNNNNVANQQPKANPLTWSVMEVCEFIRGLPGCSHYADDFAAQEIDGQALMLVTKDDLLSTMSMRLGPALKIWSKVKELHGATGGGVPDSPSSSSK